MIIEIKIPGAGESVTEAAIGNWLVKDGEMVAKDQEIAEVETDKATLPLIASESGKIKIIANPGVRVQVGEVACTIDTEAKGEPAAKKADDDQKSNPVVSSPAAATAEEHVQPTRPEPPPVSGISPLADPAPQQVEGKSVKVTPLAKSMMNEYDLDVQSIINGLRKITRTEVEQVIHDMPENKNKKEPEPQNKPYNRSEHRIPMSPLRRKLSKRLVSVKNETAMLTTFNEVDMSQVLELRKKYQAGFQEKHKQKLGLMSFFIMASAKALQKFPGVNSYLDQDDIVSPSYIDIAVAVQTEKGLMVPVLRNMHQMNLAQVEIELAALAAKARSFKLSLDEMSGGTFTITNGGIFGSMLSTPIINPPQSAILGMHNIVDRPVVVNGKIEIRPIMYVALSYDHRIIDGRESVSFLVKIKELIETPLKLLIDGNPEQLLLGL